MKSPAKPFPTLLNKTDAMMWAADMMERQASELALLEIINKAFSKGDTDLSNPEVKEAYESMKVVASGIVDAELQAQAMKDAAKEIRAMANETKLVEARAARGNLEYSRF